MKKPLRSDEGMFFSMVNGQISAWGLGDSQVMVQAANQSLMRGSSGDLIVLDEVIVFEDLVRQWLERITNNEPLSQLIDELNEWIRGLRFIHILNRDEDGEPRWEHIVHLNSAVPTAAKVAYGISHLLASGGFQKLRRCQNEECEQFFIGPPNRKWCSDKCGTRMRGRELREKRRQQRIAT